MTHIFDPKKFKKLESDARKKALPVEMVLNMLELNEESIIADVGCGIGYFSFPMSEYGKVYAIDISEIMINELIKRINNEPIVPLLGHFEDVLPEAVDLFFTSTLIHELDDYRHFSGQAVNYLKKDGRLVHLDFIKKKMDMGPSYEKRVPQQSVQAMMVSLGLKDIQTYTINETFYMVIGKK